MDNVLVERRKGELCGALGRLAEVRPCGVDFDAGRSDEWQVAYMRMVAQGFGAVSAFGFGRMGTYDDGGCDKVVDDFSGVFSCVCGDFGCRKRRGAGVGVSGRADGSVLCRVFGDGSGIRGVGRAEHSVGVEEGERGSIDFSNVSEVGTVCAEGTVGVSSVPGAVVGSEGIMEAKVDTSTKGAGGRRFDGGLGGMKKKKRGKNQRDREKRGSGDLSWRNVNVTPEGAGASVVTDSVLVVKSKARDSLEKKWEVENRVAIAKAELAEEKAKKDLEFQRARDVEAEVKKSRAKTMKETEASKVATEKAFAFLRSTGNVPGFCETVVSDGSSPGLTDGPSPGGSVPGCTISPDSSASMHEFREAQKKIADQEFQIKKLTRQLEIGKLNAGEEATFTVHSDGEVSDDVKEAIAKCKNDFFDVDTNDDGFEDEKPRTLFAKRVAIPGADEYLYDNY